MLVETSMKSEIYTHCVNLETQISASYIETRNGELLLRYSYDTIVHQ